MKHDVRTAPVLFFLLAMLLAAASASADVSAGRSRLYRLSEKSTFEQGCFPPCLCPALLTDGLHGTFRLTRTGTEGPFKVFEVSHLEWAVTIGGSTLRIRGSGEYRVGGEVALQQRLELDLQVGDDPVAHFDSGLVPAEASFPAIAVGVSIHGMVCFDTVLTIQAEPVPNREVRRYRLVKPTTFEQGCFGPCNCVSLLPRPLRGTFRLVPTSSNPLFTEYAVLDVRWQSPAVAPPSSRLKITGTGSYRVGGEFAVMQQAELDLDLSDGQRVHVDSGLVVGGGLFPGAIDIALSMPGAVCFDTRIDLHARSRAR